MAATSTNSPASQCSVYKLMSMTKVTVKQIPQKVRKLRECMHFISEKGVYICQKTHHLGYFSIKYGIGKMPKAAINLKTFVHLGAIHRFSFCSVKLGLWVLYVGGITLPRLLQMSPEYEKCKSFLEENTRMFNHVIALIKMIFVNAVSTSFTTNSNQYPIKLI